MSSPLKDFEITLNAKANSSGRMRCDVSVDLEGIPDGHYDLATDEGAYLGGEGTAPPPLALFAAALSGCLMTQIRSFGKNLKIPVDAVRMNTVCKWKGELYDDRTYSGSPVGFHLDIEVDSSAPQEDITRLISKAKQGCFIEKTLAQPNTVTHRLKVGDDWISI
jgi:uncharacterized OsmC-like protein